MLLTTILSSVTGLLGGVLPTALKMLRASQDHKAEIALLRAQAAIQAQLGHQRLEESRALAEADAYKAAMRSETAAGKGASRWVINIRALLRPLMTIYIWLLATGIVVWALLGGHHEIIEIAGVVEFVFAAANIVLNFWFCDRTISKRLGR